MATATVGAPQPSKAKSRPTGMGRPLETDSNSTNANTKSTDEMQRIAFGTPRAAALALLTFEGRFSRQAGSFLGQLCVDPSPLSPKQASWLDKLLEQAGLPPMTEGAA